MQFRTASEVHDFLAYLEAYAPNLPVEDQVSLPQSLRDAVTSVQSFVRNSHSEVARHWFSLAVGELEASIDAFASGNDGRGSNCLADARDWLAYGLAERSLKAGYVVGTDGTVRRPT